MNNVVVGRVPDVSVAVRQPLSTSVPTAGARLLRRPDILLRHRYRIHRHDPSTSPLGVSASIIIEASLLDLNTVQLSAY